jgi:hypothetical protein
VEGGEDLEEGSEDNAFYGACVLDDEKGWPPELLHRPQRRRLRSWHGERGREGDAS